jgi:hypothetical protein
MQAAMWTKLTAIGTVGSVVVALLLTGWAAFSGRRARRRLDDREARAEARKVVAIPTVEYVLGRPLRCDGNANARSTARRSKTRRF